MEICTTASITTELSILNKFDKTAEKETQLEQPVGNENTSSTGAPMRRRYKWSAGETFRIEWHPRTTQVTENPAKDQRRSQSIQRKELTSCSALMNKEKVPLHRIIASFLQMK